MRDKLAQKLDEGTNYILSNATLLNIASQAPTTIEQLKGMNLQPPISHYKDLIIKSVSKGLNKKDLQKLESDDEQDPEVSKEPNSQNVTQTESNLMEIENVTNVGYNLSNKFQVTVNLNQNSVLFRGINQNTQQQNSTKYQEISSQLRCPIISFIKQQASEQQEQKDEEKEVKTSKHKKQKAENLQPLTLAEIFKLDIKSSSKKKLKLKHKNKKQGNEDQQETNKKQKVSNPEVMKKMGWLNQQL